MGLAASIFLAMIDQHETSAEVVKTSSSTFVSTWCFHCVPFTPHRPRLLSLSPLRALRHRKFPKNFPRRHPIFPPPSPVSTPPPPAKMASSPFICTRCSRALLRPGPRLPLPRNPLSRSTSRPSSTSHPPPPHNPETPTPPKPKGAMSARLEQATEETLLTGGRAGQQAVRDAGFSEDLKARLLVKLGSAQFHSAEHAEPTIPDSAGAGTRHTATARPWDGTETREDVVRRMLEDAKPRLKGAARTPGVVVDMRVKGQRRKGAGERLAEARDRVAGYQGRSGEWMGALTEEEREARRKEYSERFGPGVRTMPATMTGLAGLANERIEEAMARGAFKGIPRGKGVERDGRADNPFIDTVSFGSWGFGGGADGVRRNISSTT